MYTSLTSLSFIIHRAFCTHLAALLPFSEKIAKKDPPAFNSLSPLYAPSTCARTSDPSATVKAAADESARGASRVG
jgi:hypothetical protein